MAVSGKGVWGQGDFFLFPGDPFFPRAPPPFGRIYRFDLGTQGRVEALHRGGGCGRFLLPPFMGVVGSRGFCGLSVIIF